MEKISNGSTLNSCAYFSTYSEYFLGYIFCNIICFMLNTFIIVISSIIPIRTPTITLYCFFKLHLLSFVYFTSYQSSPSEISTSSGTDNFIAFSMHCFRISFACCLSSWLTSNNNSSCICSTILPLI